MDNFDEDDDSDSQDIVQLNPNLIGTDETQWQSLTTFLATTTLNATAKLHERQPWPNIIY